MERFFISTARSIVENDENITGIGAMFEPKMFAANIDSYAFYLTEANADSITLYGEHGQYSQEEWYIAAVDERKIKILQPYEKNSLTLVPDSASIVYRNALVGVIKVDIDVSKSIKFKTITLG